MSGALPRLGDTLAVLAADGTISADWADRLAGMTPAEPPPPWYVRTMLGFSAWLASLSLIGFVTGVGLMITDGSFTVLGLALVAVACALRRQRDNLFTNQATLATSLAGLGLFGFGVMSVANGDDLEVMLIALIVANGLLVVLFPDRAHRFLSVAFIVAALATLLYSWELNDLVPLFGPALALLFLVLLDHEPRFVVQGRFATWEPVTAGVLYGAFGCLLLSTVYVIPELVGEFRFYPRPWLSTLLLGLLLLEVERRALRRFGVGAAAPQALSGYALTLLIVVAALPAPGVILALLVIVAGLAHGHAGYAWSGIAFLVLFAATYFYGLEVGLLVKSASLIATGGVLLLARALLRLAVRDRPGGGDA